MKKIQKILSLLFSLVLIFLIAVWYILKTIDLNQVMVSIDQELESLTHLPVHQMGR